MQAAMPYNTFRQEAVGGVEMSCKDGLGALKAKNKAEVRPGKRIYCYTFCHGI